MLCIHAHILVSFWKVLAWWLQASCSVNLGISCFVSSVCRFKLVTLKLSQQLRRSRVILLEMTTDNHVTHLSICCLAWSRLLYGLFVIYYFSLFKPLTTAQATTYPETQYHNSESVSSAPHWPEINRISIPLLKDIHLYVYRNVYFS